MKNRVYRSAIGIGVAAFLSFYGCLPSIAADIEKDFINSLSQLARDNHSISLTVENNNNKSAAYIREQEGFKALRATIRSVESLNDADTALQQLRYYGYRIRNESESRAFNEGLAMLEERIKFLASTDNPEFKNYLPEFEKLRKEFAEENLKYSEDISVSVKSAIRGAQSNKASSNKSTKSVSTKTTKTKAQTKTATKTAPKTRTVSNVKLGANVVEDKTVFAVYSPEATEVNLHLFFNAADKKGNTIPMKKDENGVWKTTVNGALYGTYYGYTADGPTGDGRLFDKTRLLSDPYAYANVNHDGKSIVVDTSYHWINKNFKRPAAKDAVIYEMHVKDFTAHKSSGVTGANKKGKYLGMLEGKGTGKVLGHLKDLGVNVIELMPVHEYDNNFAGHPNHWGYMTTHFFAPEASYASDKYGKAVKELKALIDGLHGEGMAVILDVVFNHTAEGNHEGTPINFKGFDNPGYYRLMPNNKEYYWNGTGCGNEMNTASPMTQKMILDSLKYWMNEYKVDGFRFDLGTIIDKGTMQKIIDELPKDTILTSEPWAADWERNQWAKSDFRGTRLAKWNDDFREKIRALVNGDVNRNDVMTVLCGSCFWWAAKPAESLNYLEAHDGYTLYDLYGGNLKKTKLAAIALLTAQGIPMIHAGQEFGRSKGGNDNSYDQDNAVNYIDWTTKEKNKELYELYKGLIAMRLKYPNFRHPTALNSQHIEWVNGTNGKAIGMLLKGQQNFLVLLNGDPNGWADFKLPAAGDWTIVCNGDKIADKGLGTAAGNYNVPPTTGVILRK